MIHDHYLTIVSFTQAVAILIEYMHNYAICMPKPGIERRIIVTELKLLSF